MSNRGTASGGSGHAEANYGASTGNAKRASKVSVVVATVGGLNESTPTVHA